MKGVEYKGIDNVNCYLLFIDFDNNKIKQEYDFILNYIKEKCNINKKLYVLGIFNKDKDEDIYEQDILFQLYSKKFYFEYLHVNISDEQKVSEIIMNILLYCSQYPIYSDEEIEEKKTKKNYNYNYNQNNDNQRNVVKNVLKNEIIKNSLLFYNILNNKGKEECIII